MLSFHKSINQRIAEHVDELEKCGLIPPNWHWHRDKILELEKIDENLIDDLIKLHDENRDSEAATPKLIPILKGLRIDLKNILEQGMLSLEIQKSEADAINKMISSTMAFLLRTAKDSIPKGTFYAFGYELEMDPPHSADPDAGYHCHIRSIKENKRINWAITIKDNCFYAYEHGESDVIKVAFTKSMFKKYIRPHLYATFKSLLKNPSARFASFGENTHPRNLGPIEYFKEKANK